MQPLAQARDKRQDPAANNGAASAPTRCRGKDDAATCGNGESPWSHVVCTSAPMDKGDAVSAPGDQVLNKTYMKKGTDKLLHGGDGQGDDVDVAGDGDYDSRPLKRQRSEPGESSLHDQKGQENERDEQGQAGDNNSKEAGDKQTSSVRNANASSKLRVRRRVFIWDLDETLLLFASLYTGRFAQIHGKEVGPGVALGKQMMTFMLAMLEKHFFFGDLHDTDIDHITHIASDNDASMLFSNVALEQPTNKERYKRICDIYERRRHVEFLHDTNSEWFKIRSALVAAIDKFSTGWLHEARQVLELIAEPIHTQVGSTRLDDTVSTIEDKEVANVNVLVTNTQLVPALCKCLIYHLDAYFPIDCVYSSSKVHKYHCFATIMKKYETQDVKFVAIGDGLEEEQVSVAFGLEFHKIRSLVDLQRLRYDLHLEHASRNSSTLSAAGVDLTAIAARKGQAPHHSSAKLL